MRIKTITIAMVAVMSLASCGSKSESGQNLAESSSGDMEAYESSDVNAIEQARPEIMVMPSDQTMQNSFCVKTKTIDGRKYIIRDYQKFLLEDDNFKTVVRAIQDRFIQNGYPLNDLEQTLKSIDTQDATNIADNLAMDTKTQLLQTASPDIILELDLSTVADYTKSASADKSVKYTISGIDAYTNKVIATAESGQLTGKSVTEIVNADLQSRLPKLMGDLQKHFSDVLTRGRDITVTINMDADSNQKLTDESIEGDTYADEIIDYIKSHTVKGAYKMQTNTGDQLTFTNVRIKVLNDDGTQYGVYDWTRDLQKYLKKNLGLSCENRSQGLGEVVLTVKGIK